MKDYNNVIVKLKVISGFLMTLNIILLFITPHIQMRYMFEKIELPNSPDIRAAMNNDGHIFWGNSVLNRMQEFDQNGDFIKGWALMSGGGSIRYGIDDDNVIHLVEHGNRFYRTYDLNGNLLSERSINSYDEVMFEERKIKKLYRDDKTRRKVIAKIRTPIYWYPFYIFPSTVIYFVVYLLLSLYEFLKQRKSPYYKLLRM